MRNIADKIKINHSVRKLFHLQIEYNLNYAATANKSFIHWSADLFTKILRGSKRSEERKEVSSQSATILTTWIFQVKKGK